MINLQQQDFDILGFLLHTCIFAGLCSRIENTHDQRECAGYYDSGSLRSWNYGSPPTCDVGRRCDIGKVRYIYA